MIHFKVTQILMFHRTKTSPMMAYRLSDIFPIVYIVGKVQLGRSQLQTFARFVAW